MVDGCGGYNLDGEIDMILVSYGAVSLSDLRCLV